MSYIISGIQQLGVGVASVEQAWAWFRQAFGTDVPVFQEAAEAPLMTLYTGGAVQSRNAVLAMNLHGGGGFEIWQYTSRTPVAAAHSVRLGDIGIVAGVIKSGDVRAAYEKLRALGASVTEPAEAPDGGLRCFVTDPAGNLFQIAPATDWFGKPSSTGGVGGAIVGTADVDRALPLYRDVLGYDRVVYDRTDRFADLAGVAGGEGRLRRVLLAHSAPRVGAFAELVGASTIELVQTLDGGARKIFDGRFWGDLGFIHLCFDVRGMDALRERCVESGHPFTIDSSDTFDMGDAGGRFAYIEDADGTLIEFVETHKVPIVKALGISLNLKRRPADRALPRWMIRMLGLARVK